MGNLLFCLPSDLLEYVINSFLRRLKHQYWSGIESKRIVNAMMILKATSTIGIWVLIGALYEMVKARNSNWIYLFIVHA